MKILIISDIHANLAALETVIGSEPSWDGIYCLGDTVVAGPWPNEVLSILRRYKGVFVAGNHDADILTDLAAVYPSGIGRRLYAALKRLRRRIISLLRTPPKASPDQLWYQWTCEQIDEENRQFMASFVETAVVQHGNTRYRLLHGVVPEDWGFGSRIWPDSPDELFERLAQQYPNEEAILFGNSHVQFRKDIAGKTFVCVGSVGQPRLGKPLAGYVVLTDDGLDLRATSYDTDATADALDRIGLKDRAFVEQWKRCYKEATLPPHYKLRDEWDSLKDKYV